ncbi:MAG: hypothetical protein IJQ74_07345 [Synergistaceae bacterium]|nr:hypothetical protein [Synergistaceae bacterium]
MTTMTTMFNEYWQIALKFLETWGISLELAGVILLVAIWLILYIGRGLSFFRFLMRLYQRAIVLCGLVALGFWLFYIGREHRIYLDNKAMNGCKPIEQVNISINGAEALEIMARERVLGKSVGPEFELKAEIVDENGEVLKTITKTVKIGCSKDIMISLPVFAAQSGDFILPSPK